MVKRLAIVLFALFIMIIASLFAHKNEQPASAHGTYIKTISVVVARDPRGEPEWGITQSSITLKQKETAQGESKILTEQFEMEGPVTIEISKQVTTQSRARFQAYDVFYDVYGVHWSYWDVAQAFTWLKESTAMPEIIKEVGEALSVPFQHRHRLSGYQTYEREEIKGTREVYRKVEADPPGDPFSDETLIPTKVPYYYVYELDFSWFGVDDIVYFEITAPDGTKYDITDMAHYYADQIQVATEIQIDGQIVTDNPPIVDMNELSIGEHELSILHYFSGPIIGTVREDQIFEVTNNLIDVAITSPESAPVISVPAGNIATFEVTISNLAPEDQPVELSYLTEPLGHEVDIEETDFILPGESKKIVQISVPSPPVFHEDEKLSITMWVKSPIAESSIEALLVLTESDRSIEIEPTELSVGKSMTIIGSGFLPDEVVDIWLDDNFGEPIQLTIITADGTGNFQEILRIPVNATANDSVITAANDHGIVFTDITIVPEDTNTIPDEVDTMPEGADTILVNSFGSMLVSISIGLIIGVVITLLVVFILRRNKVKQS
ncbi:hypothetical protein ACFLX7_04580 [Chloroflexota bacterium]